MLDLHPEKNPNRFWVSLTMNLDKAQGIGWLWSSSLCNACQTSTPHWWVNLHFSYVVVVVVFSLALLLQHQINKGNGADKKLLTNTGVWSCGMERRNWGVRVRHGFGGTTKTTPFVWLPPATWGVQQVSKFRRRHNESGASGWCQRHNREGILWNWGRKIEKIWCTISAKCISAPSILTNR